MQLQYNPYIWVYLASTGVLTTAMAYMRYKKSADRFWMLTSSMVVFWSLGFAVQVSVTDLRAAALSYIIANDFVGLKAPIVWLLWALSVTGAKSWLDKRRIALLFLPSVLTDLINLTNSRHGLMYRRMWMAPANGNLVLQYHPGPWFWVITVYCGIILLAVMAVQTSAAVKHYILHRDQAFTIAGAAGTILIGIILSFIYYDKLSVDMTPVTISIVVVLTSLLSRFRAQEVVPVPRDVVLEKMTDAVVILDNCNRVMDMNPAAEAFLGSKTSVAAGRPLTEVWPDWPELPEETTNLHREFTRGGRIYEAYFSGLNEGDKKVGSLLVIRDVTTYKEAEAKIAQQQQALLVLLERERLARELHDSVGQVLSYTNLEIQYLRSMLKNGRWTELDERLNRMFQVISEASLEIREFIYEARTTLIFKKGFSNALNEYLSRFENNYQIKVERRNLEVISEDDLDLAVGVQLYRIIQEALTNVRKHAKTDKVIIAFRKDEKEIKVQIIDHGVGFDLQEISPGHSSFGLTVMRERAEQVGGYVHYDSILGEGTTVTITIPLYHEAKREINPYGPAEETEAQKRKAKIRILLVDDHVLFMEGLQKLLTMQGFDVVGQARDGLEALEKARLLKPDLILMDINMPRCSGLTATRLIKAEMPVVKIVMLTISDHEADLFRAIKNGASGYLLKSLRGEELSEQLMGLAAGGTVITPEIAHQVLREFNRQKKEAAVGIEERTPKADTDLTPRQNEVLTLVAAGKTYKEIGAELFISERTVKYEMANILKKLHFQTRQQAIAYARKTMGVNPDNDGNI